MRKSWSFALLAVAAVAAGAYAYTLGPSSHWQLSTHPEDWARFGEFVGGVSVPLLLMGLLVNAEAHRQQAEWQRAQGTLDELLAEARALAAAAEQLLAVPIEATGITTALSQKLDLLAAVLSEFVSRGGDAIFLLFYRDRFRATVQRLMSMQVTLNTSEWWLVSSEESESRRWRF